MDKKRINKLKIFSILVTTTLVFIIGIFFGQNINSSQLDKVLEFQQDLRTQTLSLELQYALASQNLCETNWDVVGDELFKMGEMLARMETSLGKLNKDVLSLKEYYSLLEIKHWLFLKKIDEECGIDVPVILYFYSNLGNCDDCEKQGYVLNYLKKTNSELNIFSFEVNIGNPAVGGLKEIYGIDGKELPILVVNEEIFEGFVPLEELTSENAM